MAVQFFGQYLLSKGIVKPQQLVEAVEYQEQQNLKLGEYAVKKGYLSKDDSGRINRLQQSKDLRFGEAAIELGLLNEKQLEELLRAQKNDHIYLGDAVVIRGFADRKTIDAALADFKEEQKQYTADTIEIPSDVPSPDLMASFFDLTAKMMLRIGDVAAKLGKPEVRSGLVKLNGTAVQVTFSGAFDVRYVIDLPDAVTKKIAARMLGQEVTATEELEDAVREFANVVCGNIVAKLAQRGKGADISPPEMLAGSLDISPGKALIYPLATPHGDGRVAVIY